MTTGDIIQQRYQIEAILGQGSMGITYKALDLHTKRPVAVKVLHFSRLQEWKVLELFEREATILKQLKHPQIPAYIDYFSEDAGSDAQFVLVQDYIAGKTLEQLVEDGWRGAESEILDILLQLVNILAYLHTLRPPVIHRDINPKNIILSPTNEVYLVDFGAVQERIRTTFLGGSTIVGTYGYVPFEQFTGQAVPASDYYAVGATLLYLLTHRHPTDFPTDEMKIRFHDALCASPKVMQLLDGLLEPSVKQRIASPDQVRAILEDTVATSPRASRPAQVSKPSWSKIEKTVFRETSIRFRIPKKLMGFLPGQTLLELTPTSIRFQDAYSIGKKIGNSWSIPTAALRPSYVTWYFEGEKPIVGINYGGKTFVITATLALAEIEWLIQELQDYLAPIYLAALPEPTRKMLEQQSAYLAFPLPVLPKPAETAIEKIVDKEQQISFRVPTLSWRFFTQVIPPKHPLRKFFRDDVLIFIARLFGNRTLEMTPTWIHLSKEYFGFTLGKQRHIPTSALRVSDVTWYAKKSESTDEPMPQLVVGINHAERTLEIGARLTQDEAEWLTQEIREYLATVGAPGSESGIIEH